MYDLINQAALGERIGKRKRTKSDARLRVHKRTGRRVLESLGWTYVPCMSIGSGCKVHLREEELPKGRLIVQVSKHLTAVIDGVINDTFDPADTNDRCVYGYWSKETI